MSSKRKSQKPKLVSSLIKPRGPCSVSRFKTNIVDSVSNLSKQRASTTSFYRPFSPIVSRSALQNRIRPPIQIQPMKKWWVQTISKTHINLIKLKFILTWSISDNVANFGDKKSTINKIDWPIKYCNCTNSGKSRVCLHVHIYTWMCPENCRLWICHAPYRLYTKPVEFTRFYYCHCWVSTTTCHLIWPLTLINLFSLISAVLEQFSTGTTDIKALRAFRVLRPLRLVSGVPSKI